MEVKGQKIKKTGWFQSSNATIIRGITVLILVVFLSYLLMASISHVTKLIGTIEMSVLTATAYLLIILAVATPLISVVVGVMAARKNYEKDGEIREVIAISSSLEDITYIALPDEHHDCKGCGTRLSPASKFCHNCGEKQ